MGSTVNAFQPADALAGPSRVHIQAWVAAIVSAVKEYMQKLCSTTASAVLMKNTTKVSRRKPTNSYIYTLPIDTIILQARTPSTKMVSTKKFLGTSPLSDFHPYSNVAVMAILKMKDFTSGILYFDMGVAVSLISKK